MLVYRRLNEAIQNLSLAPNTVKLIWSQGHDRQGFIAVIHHSHRILRLGHASFSLICSFLDHFDLVQAVKEMRVVGPAAPKQIVIDPLELAHHGFIGLSAILCVLLGCVDVYPRWPLVKVYSFALDELGCALFLRKILQLTRRLGIARSETLIIVNIAWSLILFLHHPRSLIEDQVGSVRMFPA